MWLVQTSGLTSVPLAPISRWTLSLSGSINWQKSQKSAARFDQVGPDSLEKNQAIKMND